MSSEPRGQHGFTLIEMILAIVIIGVGLAGVLVAFNQGVKNSADPVMRKQLLAVAEEMLEEIELKPYAHTVTTATGCVRNNFDDVFDYNGYATTGKVCDIDGATIIALNGLSVAVSVVGSAFNGIASADAAQLTVTVSTASDSVTLTGWRTNYAK
jgi:MSHA pilin protein MshD